MKRTKTSINTGVGGKVKIFGWKSSNDDIYLGKDDIGLTYPKTSVTESPKREYRDTSYLKI